MNQYDFKNRTAVVTGGAQGFGLAIARRLVQSGAMVRIWDIDVDLMQRAVTGLGPSASFDRVDVADPVAVERAMAGVHGALGRIDVLANNAGIGGLNKPTIGYPIEEWERVLRVNLTSQFLC